MADIKSTQALAINRKIRTSPRKLNLVAAQIRGMPVARALEVLTFSKKKVSEDVRKLVMSATANAEHNKGLDIDTLKVVEATVGKALVMKRYMPRARGRASRIMKPFSQLRIIVESVEEESA